MLIGVRQISGVLTARQSLTNSSIRIEVYPTDPSRFRAKLMLASNYLPRSVKNRAYREASKWGDPLDWMQTMDDQYPHYIHINFHLDSTHEYR